MKKYFVLFYKWLLGLDLNKDGVSDIQQVNAMGKEAKERVKRIKEEAKDVAEAVKEVGKQSKDVIDAAAGKKRRGRPKKNK
jgi:methyl-accepting chemotaxis protein